MKNPFKGHVGGGDKEEQQGSDPVAQNQDGSVDQELQPGENQPYEGSGDEQDDERKIDAQAARQEQVEALSSEEQEQLSVLEQEQQKREEQEKLLRQKSDGTISADNLREVGVKW